MIIFFTLMTLMFDSGEILFGEIRSLSPLGISKMSKTCLRMTHMFQKEAVWFHPQAAYPEWLH